MIKYLLILILFCSCTEFHKNAYVLDNTQKHWVNNSFEAQLYFLCDIPHELSNVAELKLNDTIFDKFRDSSGFYFSFASNSAPDNILGIESKKTEAECHFQFTSKRDSVKFGLTNIRFYSNSVNLIKYSSIESANYGYESMKIDTTRPATSQEFVYALVFNLNTDTIKTLKVEFDSLEINGTKRYIEPLYLTQIKKAWIHNPLSK